MRVCPLARFCGLRGLLRRGVPRREIYHGLWCIGCDTTTNCGFCRGGTALVLRLFDRGNCQIRDEATLAGCRHRLRCSHANTQECFLEAPLQPGIALTQRPPRRRPECGVQRAHHCRTKKTIGSVRIWSTFRHSSRLLIPIPRQLDSTDLAYDRFYSHWCGGSRTRWLCGWAGGEDS